MTRSEELQYVNYGLDCLHQNDLDTAERTFRRLTAFAPSCPDGFWGVGSVLMSRRAYPEAIEQFEYAIQLDPHYSRAHKDMGFGLMALQQYNAARISLSKYFELVPDDYSVSFMLGACCFEVQEYTLAETFLTLSLKHNPNRPDVHVLLGSVLEKQNRLREAEEQFEYARQLDTTSTDASFTAGYFYMSQSRWDDARDAFEHVIQWEPGNPAIWLELADCYGKLGRQEDAEAALNRYKTLVPDWDDPIN